MLSPNSLATFLALLLFGAVMQVVVACGIILHSVNQSLLIPDVAENLIVSGILTLLSAEIVEVAHHVKIPR